MIPYDSIVARVDRIFGSGRKDRFAGLAIAVLAFLVYANSLSNGFVWDDINVIVNNPALKGPPLSLFSSIDVNRDFELLPYYRPFTILTFLVEERLHGLAPFLMHLHNVLLHAASAFLVFRLALTLINSTSGAILAGILFAVHPINTEVVDFLSARNTLLAEIFVLSAYLLHRRSIRGNNIPGALAGALFFLAGLFTKETAIMVLPFIAAQEIAVYRTSPDARIRSIARLLPYALVLAVYLGMRWDTLSSLGIQMSIIPGLGAQQLQATYKIPDLGTRLLDNIYIIPRYLLTVIWPAALTPRYAVPGHFGPLVLPLAAAWICIITGLGWLLTHGRSRTTVFGLLWIVAFWLPVSGIVMFPSSAMADRYLYMPATGLWLVVADQAARMLPSGNPARRSVIAIAMIVLVVLSGVTVRRNFDWNSDISLFGRFAEQYPNDAYSHAGLGNAYFLEHNRDRRYLDLAEQEYLKALALTTIVPGVHAKMGYIRLYRGDSEGAVYYYTFALSVFPSDKEALLNRGIALEILGRKKEAREDFKRFLATPGYELADARPYAAARIRALSE